jgi:hypothetical protein
MQGRIVSWKYTDVSEVRIATIVTLMTVYFNENTLRYIPKSCYFHTPP